MIQVTAHGKERMHERCGIKLKSVERLAKIAFEKGLTHADVSGSLNGYLTSLYFYNGTANNIRLYGDKIYIFCNDVLVTVYDTPKRFLPLVNKLMRKRRDELDAG
jgi:hypothetical protein